MSSGTSHHAVPALLISLGRKCELQEGRGLNYIFALFIYDEQINKAPLASHSRRHLVMCLALPEGAQLRWELGPRDTHWLREGVLTFL